MTSKDYTLREMCAAAAHEANRVYCKAIGDDSQVHWEDAPQWQRESSIEGVSVALQGATPEQQHESWMKKKVADGWKYGPEKDEAKKEHPCMVPYSELPVKQRAKDDLYISVVRAMRSALEAAK